MAKHCCRRSTWSVCVAVGSRMAVLEKGKTPWTHCTGYWRMTLIQPSMQDRRQPAVPSRVGHHWTGLWGINTLHYWFTLTAALYCSLSPVRSLVLAWSVILWIHLGLCILSVSFVVVRTELRVNDIFRNGVSLKKKPKKPDIISSVTSTSCMMEI